MLTGIHTTLSIVEGRGHMLNGKRFEMVKPTVVTVLGIRPDIIRLSSLIPKLDREFNHILIHTGQHYDLGLSFGFFEELSLRYPDVNLGVGGPFKPHYVQQAEVGPAIISFINEAQILPGIILFLGDSNSILAAIPLKKEGYKIGHIEAGMRSGQPFMPEEINRKVVDHISDILFAYNFDNFINLKREGLDGETHVVGNTIVEVFDKMRFVAHKNNSLLLDIHRHENMNNHRLGEIIGLARNIAVSEKLRVRFLAMPRTMNVVSGFGFNVSDFEICPIMGYKDYLRAQAESSIMVSDSGTAQEECALIGVPLLVPRDGTERPESVSLGASIMIDVNHIDYSAIGGFIGHYNCPETEWLGDGKTSDRIVDILKEVLL
jgi:UDP-N-acetylglucosamine 2-epimerase (non-hydrolysing)